MPSLVQRHPARKCAGGDTDRWYPSEPQATLVNERRSYEQRARQLCAGCPVLSACLAETLAVESKMIGERKPHGVYGGTAPWERQAMLRNANQDDAEQLAVAS